MKKLVNDIYKDKGTKPDLFFKTLISRMYGDLMAFYKFRVSRKYDQQESRRMTRYPLSDLDPTGVQIIKGTDSQKTFTRNSKNFFVT